jgi:hypothetical protein
MRNWFPDKDTLGSALCSEGLLKREDWVIWGSTKRASFCKKRSKTFENLRKFAKNVPKYSKFVSKRLKILDNFLPPCAFD